MTIAAVVKKEFMHPDGATRVQDIVKIYKLLEDKRVPNVDALDGYSMAPPYPYIMVTPVGMVGVPKTGHQSFRAIVCILEALKVCPFFLPAGDF
jgi:hypothetical protein